MNSIDQLETIRRWEETRTLLRDHELEYAIEVACTGTSRAIVLFNQICNKLYVAESLADLRAFLRGYEAAFQTVREAK